MNKSPADQAILNMFKSFFARIISGNIEKPAKHSIYVLF